MSKLKNDWLVECNKSTTELRGILLGYEKGEHDKPVFIDFENRDSDPRNRNLHVFIIGKPGPGKGFHLR